MNIVELDTPAILVDLDRLEGNIARWADLTRAAGKQLRPHTKTHKTPEIGRMQLTAGACGITVAKVGEAEVFVAAGFDDVFIANQVVGSSKIERLLSLLPSARVAVGIDSLAVAEPLSAAAHARGLRVPVRIEIDTGMHRAGVRSIDDAIELGLAVAKLPGVELTGVFTCEGHANIVTGLDQEEAVAAACETVRSVATGLRARGVDVRDVSVGSTPCASLTARESGITELRSGTYVFGDAMQTTIGYPAESCALTVLTTVISRPDHTTAILDSGTKTFSGDRGKTGSAFGRVIEDASIVFDWANEEHGHLDLSGSDIQPRVGDKLRVIPWHVCTCVNMHDTMYAVRGDTVVDEWVIVARGKLR